MRAFFAMKTLRQLHLYLGCLFAPLIIYFSLSGAWQVFRLNDIPKNETPTALNSFFHELSNPHTHSTLPGRSPKTEKSAAFDWIATLTGFGMIATAGAGVVLALRFGRSKGTVWLCLGAGIVLPILLLFLK